MCALTWNQTNKLALTHTTTQLLHIAQHQPGAQMITEAITTLLLHEQKHQPQIMALPAYKIDQFTTLPLPSKQQWQREMAADPDFSRILHHLQQNTLILENTIKDKGYLSTIQTK